MLHIFKYFLNIQLNIPPLLKHTYKFAVATVTPNAWQRLMKTFLSSQSASLLSWKD